MDYNMISFLPFFLYSLSFILFVSQFLKVRNRSKTSVKRLKLPPGPWKLPVIGSLHHLVGSLPHHRMRELAKRHGPLMHLQIGEASAVVVSSPEVAKDVLKTYDANFAHRPHQIGADIMCYGSTDIATAPYGGYWKQLRRICSQELLSNIRVRSFRSIREEEVLNLVRYIETNTGTCVNLSEKVSCLTNAITARAAFGEECKDQEEFISLVKKLVQMAERLAIFDLFPSYKWLHVISGQKPILEKLHRKYDVIIGNIITEAEKNIGEVEVNNTLLSVILNFKNQGGLEYPLTIDNIKAVMLTLFAPGTDTSSAIIEWAMSEMLENPKVMNKAREEVRRVFGSKGYMNEESLEELKYLKAVIKETLRLHPPISLLLPRECRETCEVKGYTIPAGTRVIVNAWAIARDPDYWNDPEKFYPERFMNSEIDYKGSHHEFMPFGAGRRMCPGMSFGINIIELCLAQLLYYFNWELPYGNKENLEMTEALGTFSRRKTDLVVVPISYNPLPISSNLKF
ncbi:premnaspirodiene oxygenase-like [Vigna radiata var. radiata]|uniref:Premnaspirodiene oxygenase-like n=1 Tax=Vigna radiata var. radiata TaxID=3916 RepID=A0A1S3UE21_VIGRR|nr:premnaspirodiene oxygenase-like [Vigna radiata var. radiata]